MKKVESRNDDTIEDLQAEFIRLKRQFCLLEDDRRAYKEETKHDLRTQKETILSLNLEHEELAKEYKLASSQQNQKVDTADTLVLIGLLQDEEDSIKTIGETNKNIEKVNKNISFTSDKIDKLRKNMGGVQESGRRFKEILKQKRVMEDRLNAASIKFNTALFENANTRSDIDHLNQQRGKFEDFHRKLSKLFKEGKEEKDFLIEKATSLFNGRDEAHHRMQSLRERSERDLATFNSDLKDLIRVIDHDRKLREFMNTKMEERGELFEIAVAKRKEKKLLDLIQGLQTQVESYETIFQELKEVSEIDDTDEMVNKFIKIEDENFASFNFVKEQNQELQQEEIEIKELKEKIESMGKEEIRVSKKHKEIMIQLKLVEQSQQKENQRITNQFKIDQKILEKVCVIFDKMMGSLRCDRRSLTELLGGTKICNENLSAYLGLIEQRSSELLQADSFVAHKLNIEQSKAPAHISFQTAGRIAKALVLPPSILPVMAETTSEIVSLADECVRPMSQNEVRAAAVHATMHVSKLSPDVLFK